MGYILVVEDEQDIQELLKNYLEEAGHETVLASDGVEGVTAFSGGKFDLVLLDVMLPKIDGFGVLEVIRRESQVPVIMLTALDDESYQIKGYDLQVDDYVTKPFSMQVLLRKIAAVLRRTGGKSGKESGILCYRALRLDLEGYHAWMEERELDLTQKEFELLREFLTNSGRVLTRGQLLDAVWGMDYFGEERIVDTHIKNLRKKMQAEYIETIRGVGYRIDKIH
ncbi:MAG: response regulator transcription factor [Eubacteriales bacterium]|nr:response regulator transcription factor [Eubacteriales bacterium]